MTLNATEFQPPNEDACVVFIEQAYDPTTLTGDEDEQFHQDDAARVSMRVRDMIVGLKELPSEEGEINSRHFEDRISTDNVGTSSSSASNVASSSSSPSSSSSSAYYSSSSSY